MNYRILVLLVLCAVGQGCIVARPDLPPSPQDPSPALKASPSSVASQGGNKNSALVSRTGEKPLSPSDAPSIQKASTRLPKPALLVNREVQKELHHFMKKDRRFIEASLKRRQAYYPKLVEIFEGQGLPEEHLNVAMIESNFRHEAGSHAGALGIWQLMKSTARSYGLRTGVTVDERKDPIRSSHAAAQHLRDLYKAFGDWFLALAAYNAGLGSISRALARTGERDYWSLVREGKISEETARFVPRFIAVTLIMNDPEKYGFTELAQILDAQTDIG